MRIFPRHTQNAENLWKCKPRLCGSRRKEFNMQTTIAIAAAVLVALALAALFPMVAILLTALGIVFMFLVFR